MGSSIYHNLSVGAVTVLLFLSVSHAQGAGYPGHVSEWQGYSRHVFEVKERECTLIVPQEPAEGAPWLLCANPLDDASAMNRQLLGKGFHIAYMDVETMYGGADAQAHWDALYAWARENLKLAEKPVLAAREHGALLLYNWAAENADKAACILVEEPWLQLDPETAKDDAEKEIMQQALAANSKKSGALSLTKQADKVGKAVIPVMHIYAERKPGAKPNPCIEQFYAAYRKAGKGEFQSLIKPDRDDNSKVDMTIAPLIFLLKHTGRLTGAPMGAPIPEMPQWQVADFVGRAEVFVLDDVLVMEEGNEMTGIVYAKEPPKMNYEITLDAMRLGGGDFFCGLTAPYNDTNFSLVVGGWGGTCVGISSLDWLDAYHNETAKFRSFDDHRWYRIRLRVTENHIQAWIDGEDTVDIDVTNRDIDIRWEMSATVPLGVATWCTTGAVRNFSIRSLE